MTVFSRASALEIGIPIHPQAEYVGEIRPTDGLATFDLSFLTLDSVRDHIHTMKPRGAVRVRVAEGESAPILEALLELPADALLH
ncbi:MAG: hypothetical protein WA435_07180 [Gallionellaceae bacterium]